MKETAFIVPPKEIENWWPVFRPGIKRALDRNHIGTIERVEWAVAAGLARLWVVNLPYDYYHATCVGYGVTFCEQGYCNVWAYVGDLKRFHLYPDLERYARQEGCHTIRTVGPRAWLRVLGPEWKVTAYVIERTISEVKDLQPSSTAPIGVDIAGFTGDMPTVR